MLSVPCRMLSAEEIITRIVQAFDLDDTAPSINWITLAVLARVSRAFSKPALDHLWSTLDDLDPLVRLLPEDAYLRNTPNLIFIVGGSGFARPLCQEDFNARFDEYAIRIKELQLFESDIGVPLSAWRNPLLPSVKHLTTCGNPLYIRSLLLPQLLSFSWTGADSPKEHGRNAAFLRILPSICPNLVALRYLDSYQKTPAPLSVAHALAHAVRRLPDLVKFVCQPFIPTSDIFVALAECRKLKILLLKIEVVNDASPQLYSAGSFPALEQVILSASGDSVAHFLSAVNPKLQALELYLTDQRPDLAFVAQQISASVPAESFTGLFLDLENKSSQPATLNVTSLLSLHVFRRLETFGLNWPRIEANDDDLDRLTRMWPDLVTLRIVPTAEPLRPLFTRRGLGHLIRNCPNLRSLKVSIDFSAHEEDSVLEQCPTGIEDLNLLRSVAGDPDRTISFMRTFFPELKGLRRDEEEPGLWPVIIEKLRPPTAIPYRQ